MTQQNQQKKNTGFRMMSAEQRKAVASRGGKASHAQGKAHEWSKESATSAGRKGGQSVSQKRGADYMRSIGSKGGTARKAKYFPTKT